MSKWLRWVTVSEICIPVFLEITPSTNLVIETTTWALADKKFMFECSTRYLTSESCDCTPKKKDSQ